MHPEEGTIDEAECYVDATIASLKDNIPIRRIAEFNIHDRPRHILAPAKSPLTARASSQSYCPAMHGSLPQVPNEEKR